VKQQLMQVLEFMLPRAQSGSDELNGRAKGVTPNNTNPAAGPANQSFPDVTLAGNSAVSLGSTGFSGSSNPTTDLEPPPGSDALLWSLNQARWRLNRTEQLLLNPLPESIREANLLVEEVGQQVQRLRRLLDHRSAALDMGHYAPGITEFQQQLRRVSLLLEGARRAQWARIRWVGALVQTYTPGGRARLWNPFPRTWSVDM
jgi:hypothetical protein